MIYGYARVSSDGQSADSQARRLRAAGASKVFRKVASGDKTVCAQLRRALAQLGHGDGWWWPGSRSTRDLLKTLAAITEKKKAGFRSRSLGDAWADTTTSRGSLMLTVLGWLAEFERDLIRARTGEGRERAKRRGVKLGRKPKLTPEQRREATKRRDEGKETRAEIARRYIVHPSTISRLTGWPGQTNCAGQLQ